MATRAKPRFAVEGIVAEGISDERQLRRRKLSHELDTLGRALPDSPEFAKLDRCEKNAYELMFGETRALFDLSSEADDLRERYGRNTFGQSCLVARRLVEHGVPYVTINYKGWDTHKQHFQTMQRKLPEMDQGMATLLQDLSDRGLLDGTIVWWGGEFGRTPRVQWRASVERRARPLRQVLQRRPSRRRLQRRTGRRGFGRDGVGGRGAPPCIRRT